MQTQVESTSATKPIDSDPPQGLVIGALAGATDRAKKRSWFIEAPWLFLLALLVATGVATYKSHRQTEATKKTRFELITGDSKGAFSKVLHEADELLLSASALIAAIPDSDPRLWNAFFNARADSTAEPPGLVRVDYVPYAATREMAATTNSGKTTRDTATLSGQRFTRIFSSPADAPPPTLSLDKVPVIAEAVAQAASTQALAISRPTGFSQAPQSPQTMVSVVWAVRPAPTEGKISLQRNTEPLGFLIGLIKLDEVVAAANLREGERVVLTMLDTNGNPLAKASMGSTPAISALTLDLPIEIGKYTWPMRATATESLAKELNDNTPRVILVIGLLGTALLAGLVWLLTRLREQAETLAQTITLKLRDQMKFSEDLIEFNPNPIFRKDAKGRFVSVNRAWEQLSGRSRKDVLSKTNEEFQRPEVAHQNRLADERLYQSPTGFEVSEVFVTNAEGRKFETIIAKQVIRKADSTIDGLIGTITDVSPIKRLEREIAMQREQLDLVISASQQGIWDVELRPDGLEYFSTTFREILGYAAGGFPQRVIWQEHIHPDDIKTFANNMLNHFKGGQPYFDTDSRARRRDGSYVWVRARGVGRRDSSGKVVRFVGSIVDISDRKEAENMLIEGSARITEAARAKEAFLATMSHEIRTPLNGVLGMATLLAESPLNEEQRDYIRLIRGSGDTLLRLINDVLDFSKIESGHMTLEAVPVEVFPLVEEVFEMVAEKAREKRLVMTFDMRDDVPFYVLGDATRLRQILLNLLSNAIKFTERGSIAVTFTAHRNRAGKLELEGRVRDTGIGIPADQLGKLFQPFTQADASTTRKYGGTGLGLAIIKRLSNMMGGDVRAESVEGEGTTFIFTVESQAARGPLRPYMQRDVFDFLGKRLLVVESVPSRHESLKFRFSRWGFDTTVISPEEAASTLMKAVPYDVLMHDCVFPSTEARQLRAALERSDFDRGAKNETALPVILFSSATRNELQNAGREMPVRHDYFLLRPTTLSKTFDALMRAVLGETNIDPTTRPVALPGAGDATGTFAAASLTVPTMPLATVVPNDTSIHLSPALDASRSMQKNKTDATRAHANETQPRNILVAEDNEVNQRVIGGMLKSLGHLVTIVDDGRAAVTVATSSAFDIVLMDIQMPELDGVSATRAIRTALVDTSCPPIVAMTAHALAGDREHYLAEGMDDYLSKPIRMSEISAMLERNTARILTHQSNLALSPAEDGVAPNMLETQSKDSSNIPTPVAVAQAKEVISATLTPKAPPSSKSPISFLAPPRPTAPVPRTQAANVEAMPLLDLEQLEDLRYLPASPGGTNSADDPVGGLIRLFQSKAIERIDIMENCLANSEWKTLKDVSHSLRGASASMGFPRVAALCKDLELAAKSRCEADDSHDQGSTGKANGKTKERVNASTDLPSQEMLDQTFELIKHHYHEADAALAEWLAASPTNADGSK
jgi:PAS domain S-box-containing protein